MTRLVALGEPKWRIQPELYILHQLSIAIGKIAHKCLGQQDLRKPPFIPVKTSTEISQKPKKAPTTFLILRSAVLALQLAWVSNLFSPNISKRPVSRVFRRECGSESPLKAKRHRETISLRVKLSIATFLLVLSKDGQPSSTFVLHSS